MMQQNTGLDRNTIDKYYTKPNIVNQCISLFCEKINPHLNDIIIEPSAGNGAFIEHIKLLSTQAMFYDIEPEHNEIIAQNYLTLVPPITSYKIHVIGNPPFGRQSSTAIKFIKKSALFCDTIAFILPKSFKKVSMQKSFPPQFHLVCETDLSFNAFTVGDKEHNVPCVFQIWEKRVEMRPATVSIMPIGFKFVSRNETPHISFRRVGINAGTIDTDHIDTKSEQSHYFIKFTNGKKLNHIIEQLKKITYESADNTVGPRSISKQELIYKFNMIIGE